LARCPVSVKQHFHFGLRTLHPTYQEEFYGHLNFEALLPWLAKLSPLQRRKVQALVSQVPSEEAAIEDRGLDDDVLLVSDVYAAYHYFALEAGITRRLLLG
jgi:hypothetical protein